MLMDLMIGVGLAIGAFLIFVVAMCALYVLGNLCNFCSDVFNNLQRGGDDEV